MSDAVTDFGFAWGPMEVTRACEIRGTRVVIVRAGNHELQVSVSPTGKSVRVWKDQKELK